MTGISNEHHTSSEIAVPNKGHNNASQEAYIKRRTVVLKFLQTTQSLRQQRKKIELLKKCYFYVKIEPPQVSTRDQNHVIHRTDVMQILDPCQLQMIKKKGKNLIEIELSLLAELLEYLEKGQEELRCYVSTCDPVTFLSQWHLITKKVSQLCKFMEVLNSLEVPGTLYFKDRLLLHADLRGIRLPIFKTSLYVKMPLIFDRKESFAHKDWAKLKWLSGSQEPHSEVYELHFRLLASQTEPAYSRMQQVTSNTCIVQGLKPGRSYEFTIIRPDAQNFILVKWRDSIILTTTDTADSRAHTAEG